MIVLRGTKGLLEGGGELAGGLEQLELGLLAGEIGVEEGQPLLSFVEVGGFEIF